MGAVASRLSDVVIVTSDNPRSEDPARIIEEIKLGIQAADRGAGSLFAIVDRSKPSSRPSGCRTRRSRAAGRQGS
jgi:UDP-N-acetylmuramoyl-L-alanyl-D-glutamate--2,6-diaminopimelate ligase